MKDPRMTVHAFIVSVLLLAVLCGPSTAEDIPLPEHPRPDFQRADWLKDGCTPSL